MDADSPATPEPQSAPPATDTAPIADHSDAQARFDRVAAAALERRLAS